MSNPNSPAEAELPKGHVRLDPRHLSAEQFAGLGVSQIAYVKRVLVEGDIAFAIHAANGAPMAIAESRDLAFAAVIQHEMMPTLVH